MNKKILNIGLLIAMGMNVATANAASSGTITFNGMITGSTCEVVVDGGAADATVQLPTVADSALGVAGATTGKTNFVMSLTNCALPAEGDLSQVAAFFQAGASVNNTTGRLKQLASGETAATNVSLQLSDGYNDTPIFVGNSSQIGSNHFETMTGPDQEIRLAYEVEYYAEGAVTPGLVNSNVVYNLQYK
ncbi:type 1 fimbrial protein [Aeromonas jandaei]|uniref:fimbrial protein n=1 Tax=Aeromonas jandaei TaxID=650 RepID=UPI0019329E04|nr:fimbrial protein [Aeromonas jandaei]MBM0493197.1 type 1 fimbrial protein [Aeromonas jandaei]MBM0570932.1 type 1 fimbrial protein [Aeromonas jandaei]